MASKLLKPAQLARQLGLPLTTLRTMRREPGFPEPLPGSGGRIDPLAVERWRREQAGYLVRPGAAAPAMSPAEDAELAAWHARLDSRSADFARTGGRA